MTTYHDIPRLAELARACFKAATPSSQSRARSLIWEIEAIQADSGSNERAPHGRNLETWQLKGAKWVEFLVGAPLCHRQFYPSEGASNDEALTEARRVRPGRVGAQRINSGDIEFVPEHRMTLRADLKASIKEGAAK